MGKPKKRPVVYDLTRIDLEDSTNNLLFNMSGGLLPKDLQPDEIELLVKRYGPDWFHRLGYKESDGYEKPGNRE